MHLDVLTPDKTLYSGEIKGVTLPGVDGLFQLLNNHAPIISALGQGNLVIQTNNEGAKSIEISGGFVECLNNNVMVLVEGTIDAE